MVVVRLGRVAEAAGHKKGPLRLVKVAQFWQSVKSFTTGRS
jgi:hypothetical protein